MTVDGCRGWRPSDAASSASSNNSGKPPASDGQPRPEKPNTISGTNRHPSTQGHNCTPWTPQEHRDSFQSLREETSDNGPYVFSSGGPSVKPVPASPREFQIRGFLDHFIPGQDIPRSIGNQQYPNNLEAWRIRICNDSPEVKPQAYSTRTRVVSSDPNEGLSGPSGTRDQKGPKVRRKNTKKQDARVTKNQDAEHRQLDIESDPKEDADTDEESSQEPRGDGKDGRDN